MDGIEIIKSFKREKLYEFSEAISILDDKLHLIFQLEAMSTEIPPSLQSKIGLARNNDDSIENSISYLNVKPIAYLLISSEECTIEALDEKHEKFVEMNRDKLLEDFLKIEESE